MSDSFAACAARAVHALPKAWPDGQGKAKRKPRFNEAGRPFARNAASGAALGGCCAEVYAWLDAHCDARGCVKADPAAIASRICRSTPYVNRGLKGLESTGRIKRFGSRGKTRIRVYLCDEPVRTREPDARYREKGARK